MMPSSGPMRGTTRLTTGAAFHAASGTVTCVTTESFGGMADEPGTAQVEIRASWTPLPDEDGVLHLEPHVEA